MPYKDPALAKAYMQAYHRRWKAALRARWRAAGCCLECGLPVTRFAKCVECRAKWARNWARRRAEGKAA